MPLMDQIFDRIIHRRRSLAKHPHLLNGLRDGAVLQTPDRLVLSRFRDDIILERKTARLRFGGEPGLELGGKSTVICMGSV